MVVLLISAVLGAVAIPTFLGNRASANDATARYGIDATIGALSDVWAQYETFATSSVLASQLTGVDSGLDVVAASAATSQTPPGPLSLASLGPADVEVFAYSKAPKCLYAQVLKAPITSLGAGNWYGTGPGADLGAGVYGCAVTALPASGWQKSWGAAGA